MVRDANPQRFNGSGWLLYQDRCENVLRQLDDNSIDLIVTDPPYFRVKGEWWDRQWKTADSFLEWIGDLCEQWQRILKPNGSLYVFASPQMAWGVEGEIRRRFNVLNRIRWQKSNENVVRRHVAQIVEKEIARSYLPACEEIIFAEHFNADNMAKGEAGYVRKCDELRGFVFEPLRAYLSDEVNRAGWTPRRLNEAMGFAPRGMAETRYFGHSQWQLPTERHYDKMRAILGPEYLRREYEDLRREYEDLRREYEDLRREYEDLRRPFNVSADVPYTDVWTFPTVQARRGKHPCEKPLEMIEHIIKASSRPGGVVLDCFAGSGVVGKACQIHDRQSILCEVSADWCGRILDNLDSARLF